jgi:hypothetical protein
VKRALFHRWLASLPPETLVGRPCDDARCPLALWLRASGYPEAQVGGIYWQETQFAPTRRLPNWALAFVRSIDDRLRQGFLGTELTAATALAYLEATS